MNVTCPHCRGEIENTPALSGQVVACPHCRQQLEMPHTVASARFAPRNTMPPRRQKNSDDLHTYLLSGILACGLLCVGMVAAWEIRYQMIRYHLSDIQAKAEEGMRKVQRELNR